MEEETRTEQSGLITEELRDWMGASTHNTIGTELIMGSYNRLLAIADRIDEQYVKAHEKAYNEGVYDGIDADKNAMGYVKLPVDADGVPIHIGDELQSTYYEDGIVAGMECFEDIDWHIAVRPSNWDVATWRNPIYFHHVKPDSPDSWERIIGDALTVGWPNDNWNEVASAEIHERLVERCRRLAGEDA